MHTEHTALPHTPCPLPAPPGAPSRGLRGVPGAPAGLGAALTAAGGPGSWPPAAPAPSAAPLRRPAPPPAPPPACKAHPGPSAPATATIQPRALPQPLTASRSPQAAWPRSAGLPQLRPARPGPVRGRGDPGKGGPSPRSAAQGLRGGPAAPPAPGRHGPALPACSAELSGCRGRGARVGNLRGPRLAGLSAQHGVCGAPLPPRNCRLLGRGSWGLSVPPQRSWSQDWKPLALFLCQ